MSDPMETGVLAGDLEALLDETPELLPEARGAEAAYERHLPEAEALEAALVVPMRADPVLAAHNLRQGARAVLARKAELAGVGLTEGEVAAIEGATDVGLACIFASIVANHASKAAPKVVNAKVSEAAGVRRLLLKSLDACAEKGLVPATLVATILKGRGPSDVAQDCIDLAAAFRRYEGPLKGRTPVEPGDIARASELGTELVMLLKPAHARKAGEPKPPVELAVERRDRLWTLVTLRHDLVWQAGARLFGRKVDEHVPPLQSRVPAKAPAKAPEPAPAG